jgi:excisionase family DNA binding protein
VSTIRNKWRQASPPPIPKLLTVPIVAEHLNVSDKTVRRLVHSGELTPTWIGRSLRIAEDDLRSYLNRCRQ